MALSRIWSAFIIIAILVASYKCFISHDTNIFSRMMSGKADDPYDTVAYVLIGSPEKAGFADRDNYMKYLLSFGYKKADSTHKATVVITNVPTADSVNLLLASDPALKIFTYRTIQKELRRNVDGVIETCKGAVNICIGLIGILALFMGLMTIAEKAGGIRFLSRIIGPFFSKLFPEVPKGHPATGHMIMNFSANLLGLDNASTPFGLKAMESLQELNPRKDTASNSQIMFLCLHAAGFNLIPVGVIAVRASMKASNPTDIFIPSMIVTFVATMAAMFMVSFKQRINIFKPVVIAWVLGVSAVMVALVIYLVSLSSKEMQSFSTILSNGLILLIFFLIVLAGVIKKINVYDAFIEGAKGGFETAVRIIPYLVGILVAVSLLRTSGAFDAVINALKTLFAALGVDTRFVDGLPTALIRPLSGAGGRGMMVDTMKAFGTDSFAGRLSSLLQSAAETTFFAVAVFFGSVNVKNTRYTIGFMLLADLVGIITAILMAYLFFGNS
jgi:spore maturation protein SpmA